MTIVVSSGDNGVAGYDCASGIRNTPSHTLSHPLTPSYPHTLTNAAFNTHILSRSSTPINTLASTLSPTPPPTHSPSGACTQSSATTPSYWSDTTHTWTGQGYFPKFPASCPYVTAVGATSARASNGYVAVTTAESNQGINPQHTLSSYFLNSPYQHTF